KNCNRTVSVAQDTICFISLLPKLMMGDIYSPKVGYKTVAAKPTCPPRRTDAKLGQVGDEELRSLGTTGHHQKHSKERPSSKVERHIHNQLPLSFAALPSVGLGSVPMVG